MVRFCTALKRGGVSLKGLNGSKCGYAGREHAYHFANPYDFEAWQHLKRAYVWEARPPFQPEPMPGLAIFYFIQGRKGIILFWNHFSTSHLDMFGGHIELWNKDRMGNTCDPKIDPVSEESAFARARKIVFWPMTT